MSTIKLFSKIDLTKQTIFIVKSFIDFIPVSFSNVITSITYEKPQHNLLHLRTTKIPARTLGLKTWIRNYVITNITFENMDQKLCQHLGLSPIGI